MKKVLLFLALGLASFAVGLIGVYLAMPSLAPKVVESTQQRIDSLAAASGKSLTDSSGIGAPPLEAAGVLAIADTHSVTSIRTASDSTRYIPLDSARALIRHLTALEDSLRHLSTDLRAADEHVAALQRQNATLKENLAALEVQRAQAVDLSSTLTDLDIRQLRPILEQLDVKVLTRLYDEASGRNRTRLMKALPPDRAARFINRLVDGMRATGPSPTSSSPASTSPAPATAN